MAQKYTTTQQQQQQQRIHINQVQYFRLPLIGQLETRKPKQHLKKKKDNAIFLLERQPLEIDLYFWLCTCLPGGWLYFQTFLPTNDIGP